MPQIAKYFSNIFRMREKSNIIVNNKFAYKTNKKKDRTVVIQKNEFRKKKEMTKSHKTGSSSIKN